MILDIRGKLVKTMFDGTRTKHMVRYETQRSVVANGRWQITPTYCEKLEEAKKWSSSCKVVKFLDELWQVNNRDRKSVV